ncbi:MAG TPA: DUF3987 domain-containing protein [Balneolaceae bacterium]|nr:DUF3987 domain-containing protein [Balneolaceae bacterium]
MNILSEELTPHDIETVLHRLGIEPKGRTDSNGWTTIKSPLRDERNPSFGLNLQTGAWRDHATDESGDLITLAERIQNMDTKQAIGWIKEQTDLSGVLYSPPKNGSYNPKPKKSEKFWTDDKINSLSEAQKRLKENPKHPVIEQAKSYDCLTLETLQFFGCGLIEKWKKEWLAFPYKTGCQLYRREDGKIIRSLKGSSPGESFYGSRKTNGDKPALFIAKSPRECMLLYQLYGNRADVIGLATGEQGNISIKQIQWLKTQISASDYGKIITLLDCDSEAALITAQSLATEIKELVGNVDASYVNLDKASEGEFKDITDCVQVGMSSDLLWDLITNGEQVKATKATPATPASGNTLEEQLDVATAPPIPAQVYDNLPEMLKTRCSLITEAHRKDVFLVSALPVIAAHLENVLAGHVDGYYTPDLFTLIVAGPGTGKGVSSKAKAFGSELNRQLIEQSKREIENWETTPDEEKAGMERPKERSLLIPANSSSRAIYDTLEANGGNGLLFENEIDTMLNATSQEWGNFSDICRKAFHHESISINRKKERYWIEDPRLSICISGTFDQFKNMFESAENGHFSRYGMYTFDVPRIWQSHRPTKRSRSLDESVETASKELYHIYQRLNSRSVPLYIDLTDEQWQAIDDTFSEKMQIIEDLDLSSHLHASNNRAAVLALRMASIFAVLRANEDSPNRLAGEDSLSPTMADMKAALSLADIFIKHAIRLYYILPKSDDSNTKGERYKKFIVMLPNKFETSDAYEVAESLDIPERTVRHWLSTADEFTRIKRGHYEKR